MALTRAIVPPPAGGLIAPPLWEIYSLVLLTLFSATAYAVGFHAFVNIVNAVGLGVIMGASNWRLMRLAPEAIWTPLFAFRLATLVFMSIGALVPFVAEAAVVEHILSLYAYSEAELAKTQLVWLLYTTLVLLFAKFSSTVVPREIDPGEDPSPLGLTTIHLGLLFFIVGFGVTAMVGLIIASGVVGVISGSLLMPFEAAGAVGVFLIAYHAFERKGGWYLVLGAAVISNITLGLVLYTKTLVLFPILFVGLALLMQRVTLPRVLAVASALAFALTVMQPANAYAREVHLAEHGHVAIGGTILQRLSYSLLYWTDPPTREVARGEGMSRLSYGPIGSFLVSEYDVGMRGDSIEAVAYALIPRFLWSDKPIVTAASNELSERVTGQYTNALAPTTAADIYWNFGWAGIVLFAPSLGALLWLGTVASYRILKRRDWFMMPFVLIAFRVGLSVDLSFVIGIFAPSVAALMAFFLLRFARSTLLTSMRPASAARSPTNPPVIPAVAFGSTALQKHLDSDSSALRRLPR